MCNREIVILMPSAFKVILYPQKLNQNFSLCSTEQKASLSVPQRSELSANYPQSLSVAKEPSSSNADCTTQYSQRILRFASLYDFQSYGFTARCDSIVAPLCPDPATATKRSACGSPIIWKGPMKMHGKWWKKLKIQQGLSTLSW